MSYDNTNEVVVSKVVSDHPNAPTMRLQVELEGKRKMKCGLWPMTRKDGSEVKDKNGNALYKGRLEVDDYQPQGAPRNDDDIPF